ncbi:MAG: hypothetical protein JWM73_1812, partial [Solirubrobacterales bacterium]|nr:hypothetical protein [Solirubrobacterales bacterium]
SSSPDQLKAVTDQITKVNERLAVLTASVDQLKQAASQAAYSDLVNQAVPILASIKDAEREISLMASIRTAAGKKAQARTVLLYICSKLLDKQTELNERLVGTGAGADNIITASNKALHDKTALWTEHQAAQLRQILEFYTLAEAQLLQLRVEWWHAIAKDPAYVKAQIAHVQTQIAHQHSLVKPGPGYERFVDPRQPGLVWYPLTVADAYGHFDPDTRAEVEAAARANGGSYAKLGLVSFSWLRTRDYTASSRGTFYHWPTRRSVYDSTGYFTRAASYRAPSPEEVATLFSGAAPNAAAWLRAQGFTQPLGAYAGPSRGLHAEVIWTSHFKTAFNLTNNTLRFNEWDGAPWGVIGVRSEPASTWWY